MGANLENGDDMTETTHLQYLRELHATTPERLLRQHLAPLSLSRPGAPVGYRIRGFSSGGGVLIADQSVLIADRAGGFAEARFADLPAAVRPDIAAGLMLIHDDEWGWLEYVDCAGELLDGPERGVDVIVLREAIGMVIAADDQAPQSGRQPHSARQGMLLLQNPAKARHAPTTAEELAAIFTAWAQFWRQSIQMRESCGPGANLDHSGTALH